jgi:hypothetical protein
MSSKPRGNNEPDWGFDWPPKQRIVPSEIVELEKSPVESQPPVPSQQRMVENPLLEFNTRSPLPMPLPVRLPQPLPGAAVPATQPSTNGSSAPAIVREELPEAVQEELRGLDADFWGPIALEGYLKRGWMMPATIVMLALVAVIEGVFLLRGSSQSSDEVVRPFTPPPTATQSGAQPETPRATGAAAAPPNPLTASPLTSNPLASRPPAPSPTIPPSSVSRQPAPTETAPAGLTSGRAAAAVTPRQTPRPETARPAPAVVPPATSVREPGWITITSPVELNVFEKGSLLGSTRGPRILLPAGGHVLQLENTSLGYRENQWVRIQSGKETTLPLSLPQGVVHVNATPWADISIDGKPFGQTPIGNLKLTIGSHDVVFRHPDLGEKTVSALVKVGVPTRVSADLTQR